jgi:hypothetical protein
MDAKLTLKLDKNVIENAKQYAALNKQSLSRLIESYLKAITDKKQTINDDDFEISPFIKSFRTSVKLPPDLDYKKEYGDYLSEKYK